MESGAAETRYTLPGTLHQKSRILSPEFPSYQSNMAPEAAAKGNIYAVFLRLAIPIKPTKLEPTRHTAGHTSFGDKGS